MCVVARRGMAFSFGTLVLVWMHNGGRIWSFSSMGHGKGAYIGLSCPLIGGIGCGTLHVKISLHANFKTWEACLGGLQTFRLIEFLCERVRYVHNRVITLHWYHCVVGRSPLPQTRPDTEKTALIGWLRSSVQSIPKHPPWGISES